MDQLINLLKVAGPTLMLHQLLIVVCLIMSDYDYVLVLLWPILVLFDTYYTYTYYTYYQVNQLQNLNFPGPDGDMI